MKPAPLMLSSALAGLIVLAPASFTQANAAGIKIKPQIVKVRPKITAAKPKVRIKVRAAKVRVKPNVRVKVKPKIKAANIKPRVKVKATAPKLTPRVAARTLNVKPRLKPRIAASKISGAKPVAMIKPRFKPATTKPQLKIKQSAAVLATANLAHQNDIKDAVKAARAAAAVKDAIKVNVPGATDIGSIGEGIGNFDVGVTAPRSNNEILQSMSRTPAGGGTGQSDYSDLWGSNGLGNFNADNFVGVPNSHSPAGTDPTTAGGGAMAYWKGKRNGDIASAISGTGSQGYDPGVTVRTVDHGREHHADFGHMTHTYTRYTADGNRHEHTDVRYPNMTRSSSSLVYDRDGNLIERHYTPSRTSSETHVDRYYERPNHTQTAPEANDGGKPPKPDQNDGKLGVKATKLYDPNSDQGGVTPFWWINEREKSTFDFTRDGNGKTPGKLTQAPHGEESLAPGSSAVLTQNDVLERYDEDSRGGGEPIPIDRNGMNSD